MIYKLNIKGGHEAFGLRMTGMIAGSVLALTLLLSGVWLVKSGAPTTGVTAMIFAIGSVVGSAVYGRQHEWASQSQARE
jgi:hypothetical protein